MTEVKCPYCQVVIKTPYYVKEGQIMHLDCIMAKTKHVRESLVKEIKNENRTGLS